MSDNLQIPDEIKKFAESVELYDISERIGGIFGLLLDQICGMDFEIRRVLTGVSKSADFTDNIAERLEIDKKIAQRITEEVNNQVFKTLRERLQAQQSAAPVQQSRSDIEKAGDFTIVKDSAPSGMVVIDAGGKRVLPHPVATPQREVRMPKIPTPTMNQTVYSPVSSTINIAPQAAPTPARPTAPVEPFPNFDILKKESSEPIKEQHKEPLADQLLSYLKNKPVQKPTLVAERKFERPVSFAPANLPTAETPEVPETIPEVKEEPTVVAPTISFNPSDYVMPVKAVPQVEPAPVVIEPAPVIEPIPVIRPTSVTEPIKPPTPPIEPAPLPKPTPPVVSTPPVKPVPTITPIAPIPKPVSPILKIEPTITTNTVPEIQPTKPIQQPVEQTAPKPYQADAYREPI